MSPVTILFFDRFVKKCRFLTSFAPIQTKIPSNLLDPVPRINKEWSEHKISLNRFEKGLKIEIEQPFFSDQKNAPCTTKQPLKRVRRIGFEETYLY